MPTIQKVTRRDGPRFVSIVRKTGYPTTSRTFSENDEAWAWGRRVERQMEAGTYVPESIDPHQGKSPSVQAAIEEFITAVLPYADRNKDWERRAMMLRWWQQQMGAMSVSAVKPAHIAKCRDSLRQGETVAGREPQPATVVRYLMALSAFFRWAMREREWVDSNPVERVTKPNVSNRVVRYLHPDTELPALLEAADIEDTTGTLRLIIRLAISTGMRKEALFSIRFSDIRWGDTHAYITHHDSKAGRDKSWKITGDDFDRLVARRVGSRPSDHLFACLGDSSRPGVNTWRKPFEKALRRAGIRKFRFHDLRHTSASYLAMSGATTAEIMDHLDHSTPAMAARYTHLMPSHTHAVAQKMVDKFLGGV